MTAVSESTYHQDFIQTTVKPLKRMRRSQIDRKVFRSMNDRTIVLGGLRELYVRHSVGFWQLATSLLFICLIVSNI